MKRNETLAVPLELVVSSRPRGRSSRGGSDQLEQLRVAVDEYVGGLLTDLAIPAHARVSVASDGPKRPDDPAPFGLSIGGSPARVPFSATGNDGPSIAALSALVTGAIYANRTLLLTPALCNQLHTAWCGQDQTALFADWSRQELRELLSLLAERGNRVNRALYPVAGARNSADRWRVRRRFEAICASPEATSIRLLVGSELYRSEQPTSQPRADDNPIHHAVAALDHTVMYQLGLILPPASLACESSLGLGAFRLQVNDLRLPAVPGLGMQQQLVDATPEALAALGIRAKPMRHPSSGRRCAVVSDQQASEEQSLQQFRRWNQVDFMESSMLATVQANAGNLLSLASVQCALDLLQLEYPDLVHAVKAQWELVPLTAILRELLREQVSIRDLRGLLESILSVEAKSCSEAHGAGALAAEIECYADWIRSDFKRYLCQQQAQANHRLPIHPLGPGLEQRLSAGDPHFLDEGEVRRLHRALWSALSPRLLEKGNAVVLTRREARRPLHRLIHMEMPGVTVMAYDELAPEFQIDLQTRIDWEPA